jgi:hypothetical protein
MKQSQSPLLPTKKKTCPPHDLITTIWPTFFNKFLSMQMRGSSAFNGRGGANVDRI